MSGENNSAREEAANWFVRLESEQASEGDWLAFEAWLASPRNKAAYEALEATMGAVDAQRGALEGQLKPAVTLVRVPMTAWATAAAGLAAIIAAFVLFAPPKPQEFAYAAPTSKTRTVTLPDSSVLWLNRGASVRVRLDRQSRRVVLERGEASFAVQHDVARPFEVAIGDVTVRDVGTEFDVVRAQTYTAITVREGRVAVTLANGQAAGLGAGEQARVDQASGAVSVSQANADDAFGWQSGRLAYHAASLAQVVEDLNRYSQKPIVIADSRAAALRFTGVLIIDDPAVMLRRLEAFLPIQSAQDADRIELRSRP